VKDVRWLMLHEKLSNALAVSQITMNVAKIPRLGKRSGRVQQVSSDYVPPLGLEESDQIGPDETLGASYEGSFFHSPLRLRNFRF
jgi:hypothetical protein